MLTILLLGLNLHAASSRTIEKVTGGTAELERGLKHFRDVISPFRKARLKQRQDEVIRALEHAGCATIFAPGQADLFARGRAVRQTVNTPEAAFLMNLLSPDGRERRHAYGTLVTNPPKSGEPLRQTYYAVFALIEAELRSDYLRMFLRLQPRWPAFFVKRLLHLAAHGAQGDRMYIVGLIRASAKTKDDSVVRIFNLGPDVEADLDAIVSSNGERLFGKGFAGAAPDLQ